ncbi:uncharacterized protein LOC129606951 [Condylostylus longicornis]|uniref:uncharacterized protein LOC129606951 n=1 Tax=Condylostylus longicornis TaxID=2530218 RepID=UPI00244E16F0|nr:uncharacterized protein LOC129606951 [Condylostylus longicornis]
MTNDCINTSQANKCQESVVSDHNENLSTGIHVKYKNHKKLDNKQRRKLHQNAQLIQSYKNIASKTKITMANQTKQKKLDSIRRIREKKAKSKSVRDKIKNEEKGIEVVLLDDSDVDDDNDDVICIPVSPPPLIAIDESDNESNNVDNTEDLKGNSSIEKDTIGNLSSTTFTKPKNKKSSSAPASIVRSNESSRCTSPCSVFSTDDFISQGEKSKLLKTSVVNDDDLTLAETVDSFVSRQNKSTTIIEDELSNFKACNMPPPLDAGPKNQQQVCKKKKKKNDYLVKENDFRALDVYDESESDLSVYSKGSLSSKRQLNNKGETSALCLSTSSSSSSLSDSCQENIIQKVKRLRKRRVSSNKESDKKDTESESENEINKTSTGLPYISKGEAVESTKKRRRASEPNLNIAIDVNSSDNEFISKLSKIVHKNKEEKIPDSARNMENIRNESDVSDDARECVTARKIAEDVIKKSQQNKFEKTKHESRSTNIKESSETNVISDKDSLEAQTEIEDMSREPAKNEQILKAAFEEIDNLTFSSKISRELTPEMVSLDITQSDIEDNDQDKEVENNEMNFEENSTEVNGIVYYRVDSHTTDNIGWCEEMYRFYNMSWGGENFSVKKMKQTLDRKANWNINSSDRFPKFTKSSRMKCFNCCEFGHISARCTRPRKPIVCYMCGEHGHREPRCPNTICLKCGSKTSSYTRQCVKCISQNKQTCFICKLSGHNVTLCPDKWRRYHSTVNPNSDLNSNVKYSNIKYCSVCAGRGHFAETCRFAKIYLEYSPISTQIKSYVKPIQSQPNPSLLSKSTITYNLLHQPNSNLRFTFSFNKKFKLNQYYGRFLKAVKLEHLVYNLDLKKKNEKKLLNISEISNEPKKKTVEHEFKSPIATEKSLASNEEKSKISEKDNESEEKDAISSVSKDFVCDSDSNYSFSDHFDVPKSTPAKSKSTEATFNFKEKTKELDLSKPQRISRPMGDLLDFIPLSSSDKEVIDNVQTEEKEKNDDNLEKEPNENENFIEFVQNNEEDSTEEKDDEEDITTGIGISHKFRNISESDVDESTFPEAPCFGKIFLPKNFSDYLLSPNGNKFLIENSNKYNIKASIDWTSVGNVLVLEGLKENQNQFHIKLMLELRSLPKKIKNDLLEQSLRVPKKRSVLIKFLQDDLERLDSKIGNVFDLHKQLQLYEHQQSKNGLRQAQKIRTKLNMILLGQAGLRDGKINLEILMKHLIQLRKENSNQNQNILSIVTSQIRDEIDKSWKYIFSPIEHPNYNELIDAYYAMKRHNALPLLKIRDRIKQGNSSLTIKSITNTINENKSDNLNKMELEKSQNQLKRKENLTGFDQLLNVKIPKLFLNITDSNSNSFSTFLNQNQINNNNNNNNTNSNNNNSNKNDNNTIEKSVQNNLYFANLNKIGQLLDEINNQKNSQIEKKPLLSAKMPSPFWSKESIKHLNEILNKHNWNDDIKKKITIALNNSKNGLLSHSDYKNIVSIRNIVNSLILQIS